MGDDQNHGSTRSSSIPVPSRMDRLDSLMKYIEGKQNSSGRGGVHGHGSSSNSSGSMPLDLAIRDIHTKGSILDRVALLENRLFQLCLEIEASSTASSSLAQTSENTSCRQGSTTDQSYSFGSTDEQNLSCEENPSSFHRALVNRFEFLGNPMNSRVNSSTQLKRLIPTTTEKTEDTPPKNGKKLKARSRRWKRLLGC